MILTIAPPPGVRYITRAEWGLTDAEADRRGMDVQPLGVPECYVHHSAGNAPDVTEATWDDDPIAWIRNSDQAARNAGHKGYLYSWAIHRAPSGLVSVIEGREDRYPGATKGRNPVSKAICYAANFDSTHGPDTRRRPHRDELDAGRWLVRNMIAAGVLAADVVGRGHSQNPSCLGCTACPGDWMLPEVPYLFAVDPDEPDGPVVLPPPIIPGGPDMRFVPLSARVLDTRQPGPAEAGGLGRKLAPGERVTAPVHRADLPDGTVAVCVNVTADGNTGPGFVQVWPFGDAPDTSIVNYRVARDTRNGFVICGLSGFGTIEVGAGGLGSVDVIVDVTGAIVED